MSFKRPMDMKFGPDGALYLIEWGSGFGGDNADSGIYRIEYINGVRAPIAKASADKTAGPAPLTVQFSSQGSERPRRQADHLRVGLRRRRRDRLHRGQPLAHLHRGRAATPRC